MDLPIDMDVSPDSKRVCGILKFYSDETWLFKQVNQASRNRDKTKLLTLGPFAKGLFNVLVQSQMRRQEARNAIGEGITVYRGINID